MAIRLKIFIVLFLGTLTTVGAQDHQVFCDQIESLNNLIYAEHFRPKDMDNDLSKGVFSLFLDQLDGDKWLFTKADIKEFKKDELRFDNHLRRGDCGFIDKYIERLSNRISQTKEIIEALREVELDYSGKDTVTFYRSKDPSYFENIESAKKHWNKRIRFSVLNKLVEEDSVLANIRNNFADLEKQIRPKVINEQLCNLEEIINSKGGVSKYVQEAFLNALANYHDPNTMYFNGNDKTLFENSVSNSQLTFGLYTEKNSDGQIAISYLSPGGAAYLSGLFEEGDLIKSVSTGTSTLETICLSNDDFIAFINDSDELNMVFKVKKKDGSVANIALSKTLEPVEENLTRGYVISKDRKLGYINIPSFYTDLDSPGGDGEGVAEDVARELEKLQKENIEGLILDLRFNGGGSMQEAAQLCGMFLNLGPLSILRYRNNETFTIRDDKIGTQFDKPILIMINGYSASASEFFTSVMQDYNRAMVVGAPSYGKSSAQVVLPLNESRNLGYCKLTVDMFYRVTGLSNQSKGVIPDIRFPSVYDGLQINERFQSFALPNDTIAVSLEHRALKALPIEQIREKSEVRMNSNTSFKLIRKINELLLVNYVNNDTAYPLTLENVYNDLNGYNLLWKQLSSHFEKREINVEVRNTADTQNYLKYNKLEDKTNTVMMLDIAKDLYIEEAHYILSDYISTQK